MARRNEHSKDELREMILRATEMLVDSGGLQQMSTRKIAQMIGYTVGTLYLFFKNLDDLILQVNARTLDRMLDDLRTVTEDGIDPRSNIIAMGHAYVLFAVEHPERWRMVFEHTLAPGEPVPDWFTTKIDDLFGLVEKHVADYLGGSGKSNLQSKSATQALWCGVHGICALSVTNKVDIPGITSVQELTDSLITHFLAGVGAQSKLSEKTTLMNPP